MKIKLLALLGIATTVNVFAAKLEKNDMALLEQAAMGNQPYDAIENQLQEYRNAGKINSAEERDLAKTYYARAQRYQAGRRQEEKLKHRAVDPLNIYSDDFIPFY